MASWTDALSSVRVLASELFSFVRVVGALPWRSTAADTLAGYKWAAGTRFE